MKAFENINTAFRYVRLVSIIALIGALLVSLFSVFYALHTIEKNQKQIYVLSKDGNVILSSSLKYNYENRNTEIVNNAVMFHNYFFSLDPDKQVIERNVKKALEISGNSVLNLNEKRDENLYYHNLINGGISLRYELDSIHVNDRQEPYYVRAYGTQLMYRQSNSIKKVLVTECLMRNVDRSMSNPHGLFIFNFKILVHKNKKK